MHLTLISASATSNQGLQGNPEQARQCTRVLVVGGGVGGMTCAGRLARAGYSVTLLEKNNDAGGRMQSEHLGEWRFDTGPSLLLFPDKYEEAFAALGCPMETCLDIRRVEPAAYRVFYPDTPEFRVDLLNDEDAMAAQLEALESGAGAAYRRFLLMARGHLELGVPNFIDRDFTELKDAKGLLDLLPKMNTINPWHLLGPHDLVMRGFFKDPRLRAAFTFQDLYVGLSPASAPAVFSLLAGTELSDGVFYPIGGFGAVRNALQAAAEGCGVEVRTGAAVASIDVGQGGRVSGVTLEGGERIEGDVVVANVDLPVAYSLLRPAPGAPEDHARRVTERADRRSAQLRGLKYSAGIIAFNWCLNGTLDELAHHNVFLSTDFRHAWRPAAQPKDFVGHPNFYVHVPSRTDPTAAPSGCDSVMVLLPVAHIEDRRRAGVPLPEDYSDLIEAGRELVLDAFRAAGVGDLAPLIANEMVISPPEWAQRYGLQHGAAFGLAHGLDQLSLFRPGNKDDEVEGLYFVGASTRPGNGVPLCFISAKLTAERVLKEMKTA